MKATSKTRSLTAPVETAKATAKVKDEDSEWEDSDDLPSDMEAAEELERVRAMRRIQKLGIKTLPGEDWEADLPVLD